jgi:surface protein
MSIAAGKNIFLKGGARADNIVWVVAGFSFFGAESHFEGTILGATSAVFITGSSINGRVLAQTAVTLQMATVTKPSSPPKCPLDVVRFENGAKLKKAVEACLDKDSTGLNCCSEHGSDSDDGICGVARKVDMPCWDTSAVTDMSDLFKRKKRGIDPRNFNADIGMWNTAAVTDMNGMFTGASAFNADIGMWNTAAVTDMNEMFRSASAFNADIGMWNTAAVTDMNRMFAYSSAFNQDISSWDVSSVKTMHVMFYSAAAFDQDITSWDVSAVEDMSSMFSGATAFNQDLNAWNVASVKNMQFMFWLAAAFNQDLSNWNVAAKTNMDRMFDETFNRAFKPTKA